MAEPIVCSPIDVQRGLCTIINLNGVATPVLTSSLEPEQDETDEPDAPRRYSTADPFGYNQVKSFLQSVYDIPATIAGAFVNERALEFAEENGGRQPQPWELYTDPVFIERAGEIPTGMSLLPDRFVSNGQVIVKTPTGLRVVPEPLPPPPDRDTSRVLSELSPEIRARTEGLPSPEGDREVLGADVPGGTERNRRPARVDPLAFDTPGGTEVNRRDDIVAGLPHIDPTTLAALFSTAQPARRGGGGGGGFQVRPIDKNQVADGIRSMWRALLLEEPAEVDRLTNEFVRDATRFGRKGGSLGLEAWIRDKIRGTARYSLLYQRKPQHVDEDRWLSDFLGVARQTGISESGVLAATERGARTGQSLQAFGERVFRSPESRAVNQGRFSQRFASTLSGLGGLARG